MKEDGIALRRISSKLSRDIRKFWLKVDKVVAFKQKSDVDEVRQKVRHHIYDVNRLWYRMFVCLVSGDGQAPRPPYKANRAIH